MEWHGPGTGRQAARSFLINIGFLGDRRLDKAMSKRATKTPPSWSEKLDQSKGLPKVVPIGPTMSKQWGEGTVVVPAPREVDAIMKAVPAGKLITIQQIRAIVAERHGATIGCPLTVGIFAWIAAHAAEDDRKAKRRGATPYWRTLKSGGYLNEKYPGGVTAHKAKLEAEGHEIQQRGQKLVVADYEEFLIDPEEALG
jgi:alkylated DNA nucleotide flippase Atl1